MTRFHLTSLAAAILLAIPLSASAATATATKPVKHVAAKHSMTKPVSTKGHAMPRRTAGDAAVDALNDQSLARAKSGQ